MTIIEPNKEINKKKSNLLLVGSIAALLGVAFWSIIVYNDTVSLAHKIKEAKNSYQDLVSQNAELKNQRYALLDNREAHALTIKYGLVKVEPQYIIR